MASISIWVFGTKGEAEAYAQKEEKEGRKVYGPTWLGTVDIVDRSGAKSKNEYFENFAGKWGIVILG